MTFTLSNLKIVVLSILLLGRFQVCSQVDFQPWESGERMFFDVYSEQGKPAVGHALLTIADEGLELNPQWCIKFQTLIERPALSVVKVRKDDFLPVRSFYKSGEMGEVEAIYGSGGVSIENRLKPQVRDLKKSDITYDIYQAGYLMRQFPVEVGYQKNVYVVNPRSPLKQQPTVMRISKVKKIRTRLGEIRCYRVDVMTDRKRRAYWIGADEKRWIYRIEEDSGEMLELTKVDQVNFGESVFESKRFGFSLTYPSEWVAYPGLREQSYGAREHVRFLLPQNESEFSLIRHQRFGELNAVFEGSLSWLVNNKRNFRIDESTKGEFENANGIFGVSFEGLYLDGDEQRLIYNAILMSDVDLFIFTADMASHDRVLVLPEIENIVNNLKAGSVF